MSIYVIYRCWCERSDTHDSVVVRGPSPGGPAGPGHQTTTGSVYSVHCTDTEPRIVLQIYTGRSTILPRLEPPREASDSPRRRPQYDSHLQFPVVVMGYSFSFSVSSFSTKTSKLSASSRSVCPDQASAYPRSVLS